MLSRSLGRLPETYLITEHKNKEEIPEEKNPTPDREFWQETFGLSRLPEEVSEEVEFDARAFARLNQLWTANSGDRRLIIKNPNNVVRARQIRRALPNAKFVWLLRNPWSVIQSMLGGKRAGQREAHLLPPPRYCSTKILFCAQRLAGFSRFRSCAILLCRRILLVGMKISSRSLSRNSSALRRLLVSPSPKAQPLFPTFARRTLRHCGIVAQITGAEAYPGAYRSGRLGVGISWRSTPGISGRRLDFRHSSFSLLHAAASQRKTVWFSSGAKNQRGNHRCAARLSR